METKDDLNQGKRQQMIAEAAYFRAEKSGFRGGDTLRNWCEAEAEIDAQLQRTGSREASRQLRTLKKEPALLAADRN
jgi:hypothetical protein